MVAAGEPQFVNINFAHHNFTVSIGGTSLPRTLKLIPEATIEKAVEILKAVSNNNRLQIVNILLRGECQTGKLADELSIGQSLTSQHLSILKMHGVLKSRREGNKTYYSIADDSIKGIVETIVKEM